MRANLGPGALIFGSLLLAVCAGDARAQDAYGPAPTSIAIPVGWQAGAAPGAAAPRLMRRPPVAVAPRAGGRYEILRDPWAPRGPSEIRDEWTLAQPKLTLPATSPDALPYRSWRLKFHIDRGNDFGWNQIGPPETPFDRRFLVDGEHQTTEVDFRYGLFPRLSLGVRVPIHWRGQGFMDGAIDWFHDLTSGLGFKDNGRPFFINDSYRIEGRDDAFNPISWKDHRGTGLGNVEVEAHWNVIQPCCRSGWRGAVVARVALPTGTEPYDSGGVDVGLQFVAAKQLTHRLDFYGGVGGTWFSDTSLDGIEYESVRGHGFVALEFALDQKRSLIVEVNTASRLVKNLAQYPGISAYINAAFKADLTERLEFEIGFTENLEDQQGTIDFGGFAGLTLKL